MKLNHEFLDEQFEEAKKGGHGFIFVEIDVEGVEEVICIPRKSFDKKHDFYKRAYADNLKHVMNQKVRIKGIYFGDYQQLKKYNTKY